MESGYKNFIYYFNNDENLRAKGFMEECRKNNQIVSFCKTPKTLLKTLKKHPKSTGIFADHDAIAAEVIHLLRKNKFKIPQQVGIVGVDDAPFASLSELNITTFAPQKKQIGALTVESALKSINGEKVSSIFLKPELIVRKTTKNN
jgi:DNA-binding LacI/PurR family transcriptional regulator